LLPQPLLWHDKTQVPLDDLLGHGFTLLRLHPNPTEAFKPLQADFWKSLKPRYICILPMTTSVPNMHSEIQYIQDNQEFADFVREDQDLFLLVRPDRYIYGVFHIKREQAFVNELQKWFITNELEIPERKKS
jgi:hypothetical protein